MNILSQKKTKMTPYEYLELERLSEVKHGSFDGKIFAMVGARINHNMFVKMAKHGICPFTRIWCKPSK